MHWLGLLDWQAIQSLIEQGEHPFSTSRPCPGGHTHFPDGERIKGCKQDWHSVKLSGWHEAQLITAHDLQVYKLSSQP